MAFEALQPTQGSALPRTEQAASGWESEPAPSPARGRFSVGWQWGQRSRPRSEDAPGRKQTIPCA